VWNYRVVTVSSKARLLEELDKELPSLLLLDLRFGEHDGVELMQQLLRSRSDLTIVLMTGHGSIDNAVTAIKLGAYDYLTKPPDLHRLRIILEHAAEKSRLTQRIKRLEQLIDPGEDAL